MTGEKVRFYVERERLGVQACVILMAFSAIYRLIGCWGLWQDKSYAVTQIVLPVFSALLLIAAVWLLGRRALWVSFIPVTLGAVFFMIKAFGFESRLQMILCILLYIAVIALYFCTVFGIFRTKWFLVALFGLPFLYHIFVEDLPALQNTANPVTFSAGMQEMGVLCIILGLFCLSLSMKKEVTAAEEAAPAVRRQKKFRSKRSENEEPVQEKTGAENAVKTENKADEAYNLHPDETLENSGCSTEEGAREAASQESHPGEWADGEDETEI